MKNLNLILAAIILAGAFYLSFTEKSPAKPPASSYEIMYVDIGFYSIHCFRENESFESISLAESSYSRISNEASSKVRNFFQSMYDQGWEIQSAVATTDPYSKDKNKITAQYILKRKR